MMRAAIAIGSNSTRMLCAEKTEQGLKNILRGREETRLFSALDDHGFFPEEKILETAEAVKNLYEAAVRHGAADCALFATSASRDAKNSHLLAQKIFEYTGLNRQFSNIPDDLIKCGIGYMKGLQSMNVAATVKHFPGADKYEMRDSHIVTTNIEMTLGEWWEDQGRIFQEVIDAGVDAVMTEATAFPAVDDTCINGRFIPAGLSHKVITELLKEKMGFQGVVITDSVKMGGFTSFYSGGRLYAEFLKAGNDMLLGVGIDAVGLIEEEVKKGTLSEERIDDAVERVLRLKKKMGLFDKGYREPDWTIDEAVGLTSKMAKELAESSLTLIRDRKHTLPFQKENVKKVCIVCYTHKEKVYEELAAMREEFEAHGACVTMKRRLNSVEEAKEVANNHDLIVYVGHIAFHSPHGPSSFYGVEYYALRFAFVYGVDKSIGISLGYPHIHYDAMDDAIMFVNAYNSSKETQKAFVKGVYGEIPFAGKSPVILDGVNS